MNNRSQKRQLNKRNTRRLVVIEHAIALFEAEVISLGAAARVAGLPIETLLEELAHRDIPIENYDPEYLRQETELFSLGAQGAGPGRRRADAAKGRSAMRSHSDQPLPDGMFE